METDKCMTYHVILLNITTRNYLVYKRATECFLEENPVKFVEKGTGIIFYTLVDNLFPKPFLLDF